MAKTNKKSSAEAIAPKKQDNITAQQRLFEKNVNAAILKVTAELTNMKKDIDSGKTLSLGRVNFFSKMLQGIREVDGAW